MKNEKDKKRTFQDRPLHVGEHPYEVHGQVQPPQSLAALQVLNPLDVVHGQVQVLQAAEAARVLDLGDAVVLNII